MGGPMGPSGADPSQAGQQLASQLSELKGADPEAALRDIKQMHSKILAYIPQLALRVPKSGDGLTAAMKGLSKVVEALTEAQSVMSAIGGGSTPLGTSAVSPQPQGAPGPGGAMPPSPGPM